MNVADGSSDPSNPEEANPYLETMHFMEALAWGHPKWSLHHHIHVFEAKRFCILMR